MKSLLSLLLAFTLYTYVANGAITTYTDKALFNAAAGPTVLFDFNNATLLGIIASPSAPNGFKNLPPYLNLTASANGDFIAIVDGTQPGNIDGTNFLYFSQRDPSGGPSGDGGSGPTFIFTFSGPITLFGFDWTDTDPTDSYSITVAGETFTSPPFNDAGTGSGFFGLISDTPFTNLTLAQTAAGGVVDPFGFDNFIFSNPEVIDCIGVYQCPNGTTPIVTSLIGTPCIAAQVYPASLNYIAAVRTTSRNQLYRVQYNSGSGFVDCPQLYVINAGSQGACIANQSYFLRDTAGSVSFSCSGTTSSCGFATALGTTPYYTTASSDPANIAPGAVVNNCYCLGGTNSTTPCSVSATQISPSNGFKRASDVADLNVLQHKIVELNATLPERVPAQTWTHFF